MSLMQYAIKGSCSSGALPGVSGRSLSMDVFVESLSASPGPHLNENDAYTNCTFGQKVSVVV